MEREKQFTEILHVTMEDLVKRHPLLLKCKSDIEKATEAIVCSYEKGGKLLVCGNGGSASDAEHIAGELMKGFLSRRPLTDDLKQRFISIDPLLGKLLGEKLQMPLTAISLTGHPSLSTAFANDVDPAFVYAQQVLGYGKKDDVLIAISTSGNASNVISAAVAARALGISVISLTGESGGKLLRYATHPIRVPETETFKVQELHLPVYHAICQAVEAYFFPEGH